MAIIINILISALAIGVTSYLIPSVTLDGVWTAIVVAIVLAVVNSTIGPFLKLLTLPLNVLTLGLVSIIINILMVLLVDRLVDGFSVGGFWSALVFAVVLALVSMVLGGALATKALK
jgi:putative membrane protein